MVKERLVIVVFSAVIAVVAWVFLLIFGFPRQYGFQRFQKLKGYSLDSLFGQI